MIKEIKINASSEVKKMAIEEVIDSFENMIKKFADECEKDFSKFENCTEEFEDYCQIGKMELVKAFENYDISKKACFSTQLTKYLKNRKVMMFRKLDAEKRKAEIPNLYLNEEIDGAEISHTIKGEDDVYFDAEISLERLLKENLSDVERLLIAVAFKKEVASSKGLYKNSLKYCVEVLGEEYAEIENLNKNELAKSLKISRPTLNSRIKDTIEKARILARQYCEEIDRSNNFSF